MRTADTTQRVIRALVTDDSALYRRLVGDVLRSIPGVEVIGTAFDGDDCLKVIEKQMPDMVTLDIQMPRRDGLSTLREIRARKFPTDAVMVCSETRESADQAIQALEAGALDLILKPSSNDSRENARNLEAQLQQHISTIRARAARRAAALNAKNNVSPAPQIVNSQPPQHNVTQPTPRPASVFTGGRTAECVCIGVSTGGPQALGVVLSKLPDNFPVPIFIVQHMPALFTKSLAEHLNQSCKISVVEAKDGEIARAGCAYIAPGGKHMRVEKQVANFKIVVTDDPPVGACKPSVDYLFNSVHRVSGNKTLAIILTGMGNDGLAGCKSLSQVGAHIIAQSAESCVVYGMPRQIAENNLATEVVHLDDIASRMTQLTQALVK